MTEKLVSQKSKPHFHVLDGLRGIAALVVLVFHFLELIYPGNYVGNPLGHGYLAVDFFFCLSGFVVAYAYDGRIEKIGVKGFFINRLIRLHPFVIFGTVIGLIAYFADPAVPELSSIGWTKITMATIASIILIPVIALPNRWDCIFPLNGTAWSLFSEYFISVVYALILVRIGKKMLIALLLLSAIVIFYESHRAGWLSIGWGFGNISGAFTRVIYSFTAGLAVFRFNLIIKNKGGFLFSALLLIGVFIFPHAHNDWIRESILVVFVFPLIVAFGAGAKAGVRITKFCKLIGDLSYPIYMTHISSIFFYFNYLVAHPDLSMGRKFFIALMLIIINILFAYFAMKYFDEPVRKWLTRIKLSRISNKKQLHDAKELLKGGKLELEMRAEPIKNGE